jgi:hypothetical protein
MKAAVRVRLTTAVCALIALAPLACGGESNEASERRPVIEDPGPVHVHGLGVNPTDGALFVATHTGLFRAGPDERRARRVAGRYQDTMGFTVTGPDRFLGSGHPDGREDLPPFLGLIRSTDAGRTWDPVSLLGKRDFHVLEAVGQRIYGYGSDFESKEAGLLVSDNGGRRWQERTPPEPLISLAIDPEDSDHLVASGEHGTYSSTDGARTWRPLGEDPGFFAWTRRSLCRIGSGGDVSCSSDDGGSWQRTGAIGGQAAAFDSAGDELYVALHDGTVKRSADDGESWLVRAVP